MLALAHGISTWSALTHENFTLRAHLLTKLGDMQAIKTNQYLKGPNGFSPCRTCRIQGCRDPDYVRSKNYYYPLTAPEGAVHLDNSPAQDWDPWNLPLRTDDSCRQAIRYIQAGETLRERERRSKTQGINGESILTHLPGFS
jgi:hypothetical protein